MKRRLRPTQVAKPAAAPVQKPVAAVPPAQKQASQPAPATPCAQAIHAAAQQANTGGPAPTANLRPRRAVADDDERPTRPVDFSAWTHDDFRAAKADRDVRLVQAVQYLGRSTSNAESNARLLVELLRSDEQNLDISPDEDPSFTSARANAGLALAIVAALGANQSEPARNALKEILLGRLRSNIDDRTLTVAAFKALVEISGSEAEPLLYTILTMPESIRPPGPGVSQVAGRRVFTGDELQTECACAGAAVRIAATALEVGRAPS